jgi:hypothetical protein
MDAENENQEKAADNDAEATEDAEAIEQLRFLEGAAKEKATPLMMFSLASNCAPYGWGSVRFEFYVNVKHDGGALHSYGPNRFS